MTTGRRLTQLGQEIGQAKAKGKGVKKDQEKEKSNLRTMVNLTPSLYALIRQEVRDRQDAGDRKATISGVIREAVANLLGGK